MPKIIFILLSTTWCLLGRALAQVEPGAGNWKTWFIPSGREYRLPAPATYKSEITQVLEAQKKLNPVMKQQINYWNAGAPGYRWQNLMNQLWMSSAAGDNGALANMLLAVSTYDATVAAWDNKYTYSRPRPYTADTRIKVLAPKPDSPSYPCEHSVAAGTAVAIISHFFPSMADSVKRMAQRAMDSRVAAGLVFPSDTRAGFELGQKIAQKEIEHTQNFVPQTPWDKKMPQQAGLWKGEDPSFPNAGLSKTVVLESASQFRPGPPPDFAKDMAELKKHQPNFYSIANAFHYAAQPVWEEILYKKIFEYNLHLNPPRAARLYAIAGIGIYDGFVACWDAKYTYWGTRPDQYDPTFKPVLIFTPPFPGYPSGHAAVGSVMAELYAYFFPSEQAWFRQKAKEGAESRFQGGIHFRTDNEVGLDLGRKVAAAIIARVKADGADRE